MPYNGSTQLHRNGQQTLKAIKSNQQIPQTTPRNNRFPKPLIQNKKNYLDGNTESRAIHERESNLMKFEVPACIDTELEGELYSVVECVYISTYIIIIIIRYVFSI